MRAEPSRNTPLLVSACLLGLECRYDGRVLARRSLLSELAARGLLVPVCPEQLGGLPTPRPAAWIEGGSGEDVLTGRAQVVDEKGEKRSEAFLRGAHGALSLGRLFGCRTALLKERSPSCGVEALSRAGYATPGRGVTTALLAQEGFELLSDEDPRLEERLRERDEADR